MKRIIKTEIIGVLMVTMSCINGAAAYASEAIDSSSIVIDDLSSIQTMDEIEDAIEDQVESTIKQLLDRWDVLSSEIDTYEKYVSNSDQITDFYEMIVESTNQICIAIREDSIIYANLILSSDLTTEKKYKAVDDIYDCIYEGVCDDIYDDIYDGLLDDMYDYYYDDILDDAYDSYDYSEWSDIMSQEYSQWSDTSSTVYKYWSNASSDIYGFCSDFGGKLYKNDIEGAEKKIQKFTEKIDGLKNGRKRGDSSSGSSEFNTDITIVTTSEEYEAIIEEQVDLCVQSLFNDWETFSADIDTFEKYLQNADLVEQFYESVVTKSKQILVMICEYTAAYSDLIYDSDTAYKEKYSEFEKIRDCTYEDACEVVKDDIYDGLLQDMKDYYYDGIIKDAKKEVEYSTWSDARSDEYGWWSDARSDVYGDWSDVRSDIYSYISDVRGKLYSGDLDGAAKKIERFKKKIEKMK